MFIDRNAMQPSAPFGGAEVYEALATQPHSAPPNGAGSVLLPSYKHLTPDGVKTRRGQVSSSATPRCQLRSSRRRVQHIVPRNDPGDAAVLFNQHGGMYPQLAGNLVHVVVAADHPKALVHHLVDRRRQQITVIE